MLKDWLDVCEGTGQITRDVNKTRHYETEAKTAIKGFETKRSNVEDRDRG